jgi:hypothetical protein
MRAITLVYDPKADCTGFDSTGAAPIVAEAFPKVGSTSLAALLLRCFGLARFPYCCAEIL